jgi:hypothetical protein
MSNLGISGAPSGTGSVDDPEATDAGATTDAGDGASSTAAPPGDATAAPSRADVLAGLTAAPPDAAPETDPSAPAAPASTAAPSAPMTPAPIAFTALPDSAPLGDRMRALLGDLGGLEARAASAGAPVTLGQADARSLCAAVFGSTFPSQHALGATVGADGHFAMQFDDGFSWTPPGPKAETLYFADDNDQHELRGTVDPQGISIGAGNGLEATFWRVALDRFSLDAAGHVWVQPAVGGAQQIG